MRAFNSTLGFGLSVIIMVCAIVLGAYTGWPWGLALVFGMLTFLMFLGVFVLPKVSARWDMSNQQAGKVFFWSFLVLTIIIAGIGYFYYGWPWLRF